MGRKTILSSIVLFLLASLLALPNLSFVKLTLFHTQPVYAKDNQIIVDGADAVWTVNTESSISLGNSVSEVQARILAEYADSIDTKELVKPEQLSQPATAVSPRILVEYADSIITYNLERPTAILPAPSQFPPTTTPAPSTTPTQTTSPKASPTTQPIPAPGQPYVDLYGHRTDVLVGEEIIIYLSTVNPITSPGTLVVQLTLRIPSGWSITSSGFGNIVGGMSTNTYEIEQGPDTQAIEVHILANEAYEGNVTGYVDYYFEGEETKYHTEATLPVTASLEALPSGSESQPPIIPTGTDNQGTSNTTLYIIIGICTATIGGVLARVIWKRVNRPVTVAGVVSEELPLSPAAEQYKPQIEDKLEPNKGNKKYDPFDPDRVPEERVLDITDGQTGISYKKLFFPYIKDAKSITIYDPYIKYSYQISNLLNFCEILEPRGNMIKIKLVTSHDDRSESVQENKLNELKRGLPQENIEFEYVFDDALHDRWIETDTGWTIIMGRGLDIFHRREDITKGFSDQTKRKCLATKITYTRVRKSH